MTPIERATPPPFCLVFDDSKTVSWGYYDLARPAAAYVQSGSTIKVEVATHNSGADYGKIIKVKERSLKLKLPELTLHIVKRVRCSCLSKLDGK